MTVRFGFVRRTSAASRAAGRERARPLPRRAPSASRIGTGDDVGRADVLLDVEKRAEQLERVPVAAVWTANETGGEKRSGVTTGRQRRRSRGLQLHLPCSLWQMASAMPPVAFYNRFKKRFRALEIVSGILILGVGILIFTDQMTRLNSYFQFLSDFKSAWKTPS